MAEKSAVLVLGEGAAALRDYGNVREVLSIAEAEQCLCTGTFAVVVVGRSEDEGEDERVLAIEALAAIRPAVPVVMFDPQARASDAARYLGLGAADVAGRDDDLIQTIGRVLDKYEAIETSRDEPWRRLLVGSSAPILRAAGIIRLVAQRRSTVLITGETGTGKELIARAVHMASSRAHLPMVTVNAAALPTNLLEAELFGHVKGAFTGAFQQRIGRFEQAHRSTLFLDEIGDLPLEIQTKLLRFLQERELERLGSSETLRVDVRLIAATNVDLEARVREGKFREDLYYRLAVVPIRAPSLRERPEDIGLLAGHFAERTCQREEIPLRRLSPEALIMLKRYAWPGNVRQLENAIEMAVALCGDRELLCAADFAAVAGGPRPVAEPPAGSISVPDWGLDFDRTVGNIERQILEDALRKTGGNKAAAAEMLGLKRTTLSAKLRSLTASAA